MRKFRSGPENRTKKVVTVAAVAALAAGTVGVGAALTYRTALSGNVFTAEVPEGGVTNPDGAYVTITGDPLVHTFDVDIYRDSVAETWTIANEGTQPAVFDAYFQPYGEMSDTLAENLDVYFSLGSPTVWVSAGTLKNTQSLSDALGSNTPLGAGDDLEVQVRVELKDPRLLDADDEELNVRANFVVEYE